VLHLLTPANQCATLAEALDLAVQDPCS
jgi:hypothetical protein